MKQRTPITSRAAACVLLATLTALVGGQFGAAADTPAGSTTTVPSPTTTTAVPVATTATTTAPRAAATTPVAPTTTTATPTTATIPRSSTSTTLDRAQLAVLVKGLDTDVARAQAINDYLAAQLAAAQAAAGNPPPSVVDAGLVQAATLHRNATALQTAAQQRYDQVRRGIGQVALAIYLGEQVPRMVSPLTGTVAERSTVLSAVLEGKQRQLRAANQELVRATDSINRSRALADRAVQARTLQLQTAPLQAAAAIRPLTTTAAVTAVAPAGKSAPPAGASFRSVGPTILGPAVLSVDELVGWYTSTGHRANLTVPLSVLVGEYLSIGAADGVRADIAFAQSMLETGFLGFPGSGQVAVSDNNFAGIGACDSCATGFHFPDAKTGVLAQLQLLHAYATTDQPVAGPLTGPFGVSGCCPTWMALTGVWATAPDYGVMILKTYRAMVNWALTRRAAAAGL